MIRVVIADDHDLIRNGFAGLVRAEEDIELVGEARTAEELLELVPAARSDVVVLDIGLPDRNGLDLIPLILERDRSTRILVLSMHPEERYACRAISAGAAGYLSKEAVAEELVAAIRRVHRRGRYISPTLAEELAAEALEPDTVAPPHTTLSNREYQLLLYLGEGRSVKDAAREFRLSVNTIHSYRRRLLEKMQLHTNNELIRYVLQHDLTE